MWEREIDIDGIKAGIQEEKNEDNNVLKKFNSIQESLWCDDVCYITFMSCLKILWPFYRSQLHYSVMQRITPFFFFYFLPILCALSLWILYFIYNSIEYLVIGCPWGYVWLSKQIKWVRSRNVTKINLVCL